MKRGNCRFQQITGPPPPHVMQRSNSPRSKRRIMVNYTADWPEQRGWRFKPRWRQRELQHLAGWHAAPYGALNSGKPQSAGCSCRAVSYVVFSVASLHVEVFFLLISSLFRNATCFCVPCIGIFQKGIRSSFLVFFLQYRSIECPKF